MAKVKVDIVGDSSSLQKAFKSAGGAARGFGSTAAKAGKIAAAGVAIGVGAAGYALVKFSKAAMDAEASMAKVQKMLANQGISWEKHGKHIDETIQKHAALSGFDDEELAESFANMVRTTGDVNKAFKLNALAADIARSKGMDLAGAQSLLARVYNGSFMGVKRLGISVEQVTTAQDALKASTSKATDEQKRAAKEADAIATRQQAIALLQQSFAGQAEAYGKTAAGAMDRFKVASENLQEQLGGVFLPVIAKVASGAAAFIQRFTEAKTASDKFRVVTDQVRSTAEQAFKAISEAARKINWSEVLRQVQDGMRKAAIAGYEAFGDALARVNWNQVGREVGQNVVRGLKMVNAAVKAVNWGDVGKYVVQSIKSFLAGVNWWDVYKALVSGMLAVNRAVAAIILGAGIEIGKALIQGIVKGLDSLRGWISAKVAELAGLIPGWMRGVLGISSPSKVMADLVGKPIVQGIVSGMESQKLMLAAASTKIADDTKQAFIDKVRDAQRDIKDAFQSWGDAAIAAYDDNWDRLQKRISDKRTKKSLAGDVDTAKKDLADAKVGLKVSGIMNEGESLEEWSARNKEARDRVIEAQKTLDAALQAQRDFAAEQKHAQDRAQFIAEVAQVQKDGATLVMKHGENHTAILKKIKGFEKQYQLHGKGLGDSIADGLRDATGNVIDAARDLINAINKILNIRGPVSEKVDNATGKKPTGKAVGGPVRAGTGYVVGERGPEYFVPSMSGHIIPNAGTGSAAAMGGGGTTIINVSVPNYVGDSLEFVDWVHNALLQKQRRVGSLGIV